MFTLASLSTSTKNKAVVTVGLYFVLNHLTFVVLALLELASHYQLNKTIQFYQFGEILHNDQYINPLQC